MDRYHLVFRRPGEGVAFCVDGKERVRKIIKAFREKGYTVEVKREPNR